MTEFITNQGESTVVDFTSSSRGLPVLLPVSTQTKLINGRLCMDDVISRALTLGLMGYPYLLADGIHGIDGGRINEYVLLFYLLVNYFI